MKHLGRSRGSRGTQETVTARQKLILLRGAKSRLLVTPILRKHVAVPTAKTS